MKNDLELITNSTAFIASWQENLNSTTKKLVEEFVPPENESIRYLFGRNIVSEYLLSKIKVAGIVDDFAAQGTIWNDTPVVSRSQVPQDAIVVNCVSNSKPWTAHRAIETMEVYGKIAYSDLYCVSPSMFEVPEFVQLSRLDVLNNQDKWLGLYERLDDQESKDVMLDLIRYRLTGDYAFTKEYKYRPTEQYYEDFGGAELNKVFVDCGGYDGDTTEEFCNRYPNYERVFMFEPAAKNIRLAEKRLAGRAGIELIELGVSDVSGKLTFNGNSGTSSIISDSGDETINVTTVDEYIKQPVTFIKMDLEGWEIKALTGSRNHIANDRPKLAIAVYHYPNHFWEIPEFIFAIRNDYKIHLRHYTESWTETVMYFIPN